MKIRELRRVDALLREHGAAWSNPRVAAEAGEGVLVNYVARRREALGVPAYRGRGWETRGAVDWSAVDWSLTDRQIAERVDRDVSTVAAERRRRRWVTVDLEALDALLRRSATPAQRDALARAAELAREQAPPPPPAPWALAAGAGRVLVGDARPGEVRLVLLEGDRPVIARMLGMTREGERRVRILWDRGVREPSPGRVSMIVPWRPSWALEERVP